MKTKTKEKVKVLDRKNMELQFGKTDTLRNTIIKPLKLTPAKIHKK